MRLRPTALLLACLLLPLTQAAAQNNTLSFTHVTARPGEERVLPLSGTFSDGMSGLVVTMLFNPAVIQVLDVTTAALTDDFTLQSTVTDGRLTIAMASANEMQSVVPEAILELRVRVIGAPGSVTGLDLVSAVADEGDLSVTTTDGSLTVVREASILGWVLYYADLAGVPDVLLSASGVASAEATTDADGRYEIGPTAVGDYELSLARDDGPLDDIDALDAVDILRSLIGALRLSADQQFVADVSGNGVIGTNDAGLILRFLVGLETSFPAGAFWQFQPGSLRFQPLIRDEFRNFTAYLIGDVDGSWSSGGAGRRLAAAGPSLRLEALPSRAARRGALRVSAEDLAALRGGTLELRYDPQRLRATSVRRAGLDGGVLLAANLDEPGRIRVAFAGTEAITGETDLLRIEFEELGTGGMTTSVRVASARLNRQDLAPAALARLDYRLGRLLGDITGDGVVDLEDFFLFIDHMGSQDARFDLDESGDVNIRDLFIVLDQIGARGRAKALGVVADLGLLPRPELEQNAPNPFNAETVITFHTAAGGPARLRLYDLAGQTVRTLWEGHRAAGTHAVRWDGRGDDGRAVASGPYIYRLEAGGTVETRKLLLLR